MNEYQRLYQLSKQLKERYPVGTRIELLSMGSDPNPINSGTRGTVKLVDDLGTIHCEFDDGRFLGIIPSEDRFRTLTAEEINEERIEEKNKKYIDAVNKEVIPCIEWIGMKNAYRNGDMSCPTDLLKMLWDKYLEVYESSKLDNDMEMVTVPGVVQAKDGNIYPALIDIDCSSSGEHWGTTVFTPMGVLSHQSENPKVKAEMKKLGNYEYWYAPQFDGDIHINMEDCPSEVRKMLSEATGEDFIMEGGLTY